MTQYMRRAAWLVLAQHLCGSAAAQPAAEPQAQHGVAASRAATASRMATRTATEAQPESSAEPAPAVRVWPMAAALVAGPIAHGAGHLVAGQTRTGLRLLAGEGLGLLGIAAGLAGLALTGASEKTALPLSGITALGAGLFASSLLADIYGVATPSEALGRAVYRPALVAEAGLLRVIDTLFAYDALAYLRGRTFVGRHSLTLQATLAMDHDNQRLRGMYAYRLAQLDAATYLDAELGAVHHRFAPERFSMTFAEASLSGRLGLAHIGPTLRGAFVEGAFGVGFGAHRYFDIETESDSLLLIRLGFGFFIGDGGSWTLYYDHRHDGYAGGMKLPGLASGVLGHVGSCLQYYLTPDWGLALRAESGSAHLLGLSVLYRRKRW